MIPLLGSGITMIIRRTLNYPYIRSAILPEPHEENLSVPEPPEVFEVDSQEEEKGKVRTQRIESEDREFMPITLDAPHKITQNEIKNLVRDLELSNSKAELLASRMLQ